MFDWDDKELANIIWGEASENGDHIVPLRDGAGQQVVTSGSPGEKQWTKGDIPNKLADQKQLGVNNDLAVSEFDTSSQCDTDGLPDSGFENDSWPDSPLPGVACCKIYDDGNACDSLGIKASHGITVDTAQLDNDPQYFRNEHEEKEQGDFLDYSWANIGSFDDLDSIFSTGDPLFGSENNGNGDELRSSSVGKSSSPTNSCSISAVSPSPVLGAPGSKLDQHDTKPDFVRHEGECPETGFGKTIYPYSKISGEVCGTPVIPVDEYDGGRSKLLMKKSDTKMIDKMDSFSATKNLASQAESGHEHKVNGQHELLKCSKNSESKTKLSQILCSDRSPDAIQFQQCGRNFLASSTQAFPSSVLSSHRSLGGCHPFISSQNYPYFFMGCGNAKHNYPYKNIPNVSTERDKGKSVHSDFSPASSDHVSCSKNSLDVLSSSRIMTPQEKIDKLRRRQQMQAMIAIQKQQQQFGQGISCPHHSDTPKGPREDQTLDTVESNSGIEENINVPIVLDPNSSSDKDDSSLIPISGDCSFEGRVVDQLQDVISKLDARIRLCVRDSLFRLAQSATQRQNSSCPSSTRNDRDLNNIATEEETKSYSRSSKVPDSETKTNSVDRTVAYLLFHRPAEISTGSLKGETRIVSNPQHTVAETHHMDHSSVCISTSENASQ